MTSSKTKSPKRFGFSAVAGALVLALWLATPMAAPAQTFTIIYSFNPPTGAQPEYESLVQGRDGYLYGTTRAGGYSREHCEHQSHSGNQCGTVFKISPSGSFKLLYKFCKQKGCPDGVQPWVGLVLGTDGNLWGTAQNTVFKITASGVLTTISNLGGFESALVEGTNGNFYGSGEDRLFEMTPSGEFTWFSGGWNYIWPLMQATDRNFYGNGGQTVFRLTPAGDYTTLYTFSGPDGSDPTGALFQGTDGRLYGTTSEGGSNGAGTIFRISLGGKLETLYNFCSLPNCADGSWPEAGLIQATDGNFYGTTCDGGANGSGTIFQITPSGALTTEYGFAEGVGGYCSETAVGGLLQATNGVLYGTTQWGPGNSSGTVYSLDMGLGPFVAFVRDSGKVGQNVQILGQGFTGTTGVSFNGTPASYTVKRDTYLVATVPQGATTGYVTVTTPGGVLQSNVKFRVRQ